MNNAKAINGIINGHPCSVYRDGTVDDKLMSQISPEDTVIVFSWIAENLRPTKTINHNHTSYGMKHMLEHDTKIYLTNNQFKDAMLLLGFVSHNIAELNWEFNVSEHSRAFKPI